MLIKFSFFTPARSLNLVPTRSFSLSRVAITICGESKSELNVQLSKPLRWSPRRKHSRRQLWTDLVVPVLTEAQARMPVRTKEIITVTTAAFPLMATRILTASQLRHQEEALNLILVSRAESARLSNQIMTERSAFYFCPINQHLSSDMKGPRFTLESVFSLTIEAGSRDSFQSRPGRTSSSMKMHCSPTFLFILAFSTSLCILRIQPTARWFMNDGIEMVHQGGQRLHLVLYQGHSVEGALRLCI